MPAYLAGVAPESDRLRHGRDAADAAYRIATSRRLAWHELDALEPHAHLDQVEGTDHGWSAKAVTLRNRLIPDGLDPNPLATAPYAERDDSSPTSASSLGEILGIHQRKLRT